MINRSPLFVRTFATFRNDCHGKLLSLHVPHRSFNVNNGRGAQEPFLSTVGLLGDGSVQAQHGSHGYRTKGVLGDMFANNASDFAVGIVYLGRVQFAFTGGALGEVLSRAKAL